MRQYGLTHHGELQPSYPQFENYVGGGFFIYQGVSYRWERALGEGMFGTVSLFKSFSYTQSNLAPIQPISVVVKTEKATIVNRGMIYCEGPSFSADARWNQVVYGLGVLSGDSEQKNRPHAILMKYIEGVTLESIHPRTMREMVGIFIAVVAAVQYLHQAHGMVHGDIKTPNFIYGHDGKCYPIDFGLSERRGDKKVGAYEIPKGKNPRILFAHIPPELFGDELIEADPAQDIYALGDLLLRMTQDTVRNGRLALQETAGVEPVVKKLCALNPVARLPLDQAVSILHATFLSVVPRPLPDLSKKQRESEGEATVAVNHVSVVGRSAQAERGGNRAASAGPLIAIPPVCSVGLFVRLPGVATSRVEASNPQNPNPLNQPVWKH